MLVHPKSWRVWDHAWRSSMWKRSRAFIVTAVVAGLALYAAVSNTEANDSAKAAANASATNGALIQSQTRASNRHHKETAKQNRTIIGLEKVIVYGEIIVFQTITDHSTTLNEIATLQKQLVAIEPVIAGLPAADAYLGALARALIIDVNALCGSNPSCVAVPVPPT